MTAHTGQAFIAYAESHSCKCETPRTILFTSRSHSKAVATANAHWCVYVAFYGDLVHWHDIIVVDTRDGVIVWRNGHPLKEGMHGESRTNKAD